MSRPGPPSPPDAAALVGLLAEPDRLLAFAAVALGAATADAVATVSGLDARAAVLALERLVAGSLVVPDGDGGLRVAADRFKDAARAAAAERRASAQENEDFGGVAPDAATVLRNFVTNGRLDRIPSGRSKRLVVLDWLAARFEPGKTYPERDVNLMLGMVHHDVAALRRYLVDEEFLERRDGFYWRAGGTFDVAGDLTS
ncbi:MAG TPA: DUF2087 domain-containing protein [Acidimicrobiales bacterium]